MERVEGRANFELVLTRGREATLASAGMERVAVEERERRVAKVEVVDELIRWVARSIGARGVVRRRREREWSSGPSEGLSLARSPASLSRASVVPRSDGVYGDCTFLEGSRQGWEARERLEKRLYVEGY